MTTREFPASALREAPPSPVTAAFTSPRAAAPPRPERPSPRQLSHQLRKEHDPHLHRRRWLVGLSFGGAFLGKVISLYQMGMLKRLPDLPLPHFEANRIDASAYAYQRVQTPDGLLMVASYATTAALAGAGGRDRARTDPYLPLALAGKTLIDAGVALKLGRDEWKSHRAVCGYCQAATLLSLASVALAVPEALAALRHLRDGRQAA